MLFMVIERFRDGYQSVGQRFKEQGRMVPQGVTYRGSWITEEGDACYQVMEAENAEALQPWIAKWYDLVAFEVIPVLTSADFWSDK